MQIDSAKTYQVQLHLLSAFQKTITVIVELLVKSLECFTSSHTSIELEELIKIRVLISLYISKANE